MTQYTKPNQSLSGVPGGLTPQNANSPAGVATAALANALNGNVVLNLVGGGTISFSAPGSRTLPSNTQFGSGAPSTLVGEGVIYFDTSTTPYGRYVQHSGAWKQA